MVAITIGALHVGSAVIARHRAQAAADMAALAAATAMPVGAAAACAKAAGVVRAMGATQTGCAPDGLDVVVEVDAELSLTLWRVGAAHAMARAGPEFPY
jgi:secretion/DNA translocation related TadE-like protein